MKAEKQELESRKTKGLKDKPVVAVKPTSNLIIRAINETNTSGSKNIRNVLLQFTIHVF